MLIAPAVMVPTNSKVVFALILCLTSLPGGLQGQSSEIPKKMKTS
jgi:hypothetical protein